MSDCIENHHYLFSSSINCYYLYFFFSETDESCKKHLGRVLSIWEERSVYENDVLEQLKQALCKCVIFYHDLFVKMFAFIKTSVFFQFRW